ncbi:MAG TPA: hypothetical protein GX510_10090 [Firmicutes bacterium]|nr:hypothetical protein [Candidatus Fermentithermobacillaceae bacterium]
MRRLTDEERRELNLEMTRIWADNDFRDPETRWENEEARLRFRSLWDRLQQDRAARRREERRKAKRLAEGKTWAEH